MTMTLPKLNTKDAALERRVSMTAFFGRHYDSAIDARDWRRLKALERWAAVFNMPLLESKAHRALDRITPKNH